MIAAKDTDRPIGIDEYARMPDDGDRTELVRGRLVREPQPGYQHGDIQLRLGAILIRHIDGRGLDLACVGPIGFVLERDPPTVRGPDLAVLRTSRVPVSDFPGFVAGAPDLAVEIRSPSNAAADIKDKVRDYLAAGARFVWVLDPATRTVAVHEPDSPARSLGIGESLDGGDLLPGLRIDLSALFRV